MSDMNWLNDWYQGQCDGDWEHEHGMVIATLDNPGWQISISLTGTSLEKANLEPMLHENDNDEDDWYDIKIGKDENLPGPCFIAFCGPKNFNAVAGIFKNFYEKTGS